QDGNVRPVVTRTFHSFSEAAEENGQSRIYLGIHWRFDKVEGIKAGDAIADFAFSHLLRPVRGGSDTPAPPPAARLAAIAAMQTDAFLISRLRSIGAKPAPSQGGTATPAPSATAVKVARELATMIAAGDLPPTPSGKLRSAALSDLAFL